VPTVSTAAAAIRCLASLLTAAAEPTVPTPQRQEARPCACTCATLWRWEPLWFYVALSSMAVTTAPSIIASRLYVNRI